MDIPPDEKLLTIRQLMTAWGYRSRTSIYRAVKDGRLPPPVDIGRGQIRWLNSAVASRMRSLPQRHP